MIPAMIHTLHNRVPIGGNVAQHVVTKGVHRESRAASKAADCGHDVVTSPRARTIDHTMAYSVISQTQEIHSG